MTPGARNHVGSIFLFQFGLLLKDYPMLKHFLTFFVSFLFILPEVGNYFLWGGGGGLLAIGTLVYKTWSHATAPPLLRDG